MLDRLLLRTKRKLAKEANAKIELLVLQPTPFCNINCSYCYLPERDSKKRMNEATIARAFERLFESPYLSDRLSVVWHAGEPLVLPVAYYERALRTIDSINAGRIRIDHSFQTNGLLIDADWISFVRENGIRLGLSIDGPRDIHDRHRRTRGGRGTFDRAIAAVRRLNEAGMDFHVISVLTADSLRRADDLFHFYRTNGIRRVGFNIEEIEAANTKSSLQEAGIEGLFRAFLRRFLELMKLYPGALEVRELSAALAGILGPNWPIHNPQTTPLSILSIDVEGNYSTFSPEFLGVKDETYGDFVFGNVHDDPIESLLAQPKFQDCVRDIARGVERCRAECDYFALCGGGAPANKYFENGNLSTTETLFCRLTKQAVTDVVVEDLERLSATRAADRTSGHRLAAG